MYYLFSTLPAYVPVGQKIIIDGYKPTTSLLGFKLRSFGSIVSVLSL